MQEVRCCVVGLCHATTLLIDLGTEGLSGIIREFRHEMYGEVILTFCIYDSITHALFVYKNTGVSYLSPHLGIERSSREYNLIEVFILLLYVAIAKYRAVCLRLIVPDKVSFPLCESYPIVRLKLSGTPCSSFLLCHLTIKSLLVESHTMLTQDQFRQV